ncbi:hypothetical protein ACIBG7_35850 [Nonomuraea sp. NPDC050328]|uniref:hypothetical protein n=1 Tax=Nonomuraea sp. NPDC050328 TaxID=3364361 RepID=UPI0037974B0F
MARVAATWPRGIQGGIRADQHLRQVLGDLEVVAIPATVALTLVDDFQDHVRAPIRPRMSPSCLTSS